MRRFLCLMTASILFIGCSTQRNEQPPAEAATETASVQSEADVKPEAETLSGAKAVVPGEVPVIRQAIELPFSMSLSGTRQGDETVVTLTIDYKTALGSAPLLRLTPKGDTEIVGMMPELHLKRPEAAGTVTQTIRLRGTDPGVEVSVSMTDNGFGVEVHDEWPPKKVPHIAPETPMEPLPAPIVVDGMEIDRGVRVRPE